ncbi:hypothetical protein BJV78DRAFT_1286112 [Lactifluus subvellereus]|nr:hypothetical protein BJV78DRAFT_1286112 [Lactifluus subvellereus]
MADAPDTNPSQLLTELSYLHQLLEAQEPNNPEPDNPEPDNRALVPTDPPDAPVAAGEPDKNPSSSESSGSQLTSSDKLSALPSHLRTSPAGRSAIGLRTNQSSSEGLDLPSTLETRFPSPVPRPPPISHSQSEGAAEGETPSRQRVSFDSERDLSTSARLNHRQLPTASEPILPSAHGSTFTSLLARAQESVQGSSHREGRGHSRKASQARKDSVESHARSRTGSPTRSPSPSRAVLPLRHFFGRFSPLGRVQSKEEPFIPIDPFRLHAPLSLNPFARCFGARPQPPDIEGVAPGSPTDTSCACACVPIFGSARFHNVHVLALDTLPRQLYLHLQLRLPSLYFSRVARIYEDAAVSRPEIQRIIDACEAVGTENVQNGTPGIVLPFPEEWVPPNVSPALARFKRSWESFVDSLVREWKTLNVLSALLLTAILTLFQIQDAANDPLTRTASLCSLISALMSLSYGIMYIVRFGNMRSMYRASRWAEEAQKTETAIFWNVWVLLALPGIWLAWSVLAFVIAIMSFVWRTGANGDKTSSLPPRQELGPRIGLTCQLVLGLVYFALVIRTFRNYGESGRRARVVRRLADVQIELEARAGWERDRDRDDTRPQAWESEEGTRQRRQNRANDGVRQTEKPPLNELGLSGMDRKQDVAVTENGDVPANESFSYIGI